jgi:hypothetical protein
MFPYLRGRTGDNHDSHILGRDCNSGPVKCEAGATINRRRVTEWQKPSS